MYLVFFSVESPDSIDFIVLLWLRHVNITLCELSVLSCKLLLWISRKQSIQTLSLMILQQSHMTSICT